MTQMNNITELKSNQVFVFGSNILGKHGGGAAKTAYEKFGAIYGIGFGRQGSSYAIPTLDHNFEKLPLSTIKHYLYELREYAHMNPNEEFLLTPIGTGIAGYSIEELESILPNKLPENINPTWRDTLLESKREE